MNVAPQTNNSTLRRCLICFNSNRISSSDIYYFQLPADPVVAAQWFRNLNRNELVKHLFQKDYSLSVWICSEHFPKSAIHISPPGLGEQVATLAPGTLPLVVQPDKKISPVIRTAVDRNLLFCRQTPVETELAYFRQQFANYQHIKKYRIHCTTCDAHINLSPLNKDQIQVHTFLKVIQCDKCFHVDGKRCPLPLNKDLTIQCQCGVANTMVKCYCTVIFCKVCNWKTTNDDKVTSKCLWCTPAVTLDLRALQWAVFKVLNFKYKSITTDEKYKDFTTERIQKLLEKDLAGCCGNAIFSQSTKPLTNLELSSTTIPPQLQNSPIVNVIKQNRPLEIKTYTAIPSKKIVVINSFGKPVVVDKLPPVTPNNISMPSVDAMPPLARITKTIIPENIPIMANVASLVAKEFPQVPIVPSVETVIPTAITNRPKVAENIIPAVEEPSVQVLKPVKSYSKFKKPAAIAPTQSRRYRPKHVLDDRCLEIKSNFKTNGTFLKTLCDHFMFKVENMQTNESPPPSDINLHQQLISAIGDICDQLESVKEKCMQDLQKCSEAQVIPTPPLTIQADAKDDVGAITVSNNIPVVADTASEEMVVSIPVVIPNDEEEDEEEVYELYDIVDADFPECDVTFNEDDAEPASQAEA